MTPTVSVVVPSYRRADQLVHCLDALLAQQRPAQEIIVVRRDTDAETAAVVQRYRGRVVEAVVSAAGVLAAMRLGVSVSGGDIVAFTDDDAVARPSRPARLEAHYADAGVGGVGGRDVSQPPRDEPLVPSDRVGRLTAWGKLVGSHDVGAGPAVDTCVLKGVNMSFRRAALALPVELRSAGAQAHFEVAVAGNARSHGWRLVYDPEVLVDHFHGPRFDNDQRERPDGQATKNEAYNLVLCYLSFVPGQWWRRATFGLLVGDRATPGLLRAGLALVRGDRRTVQKLRPALAGQIEALRDVRRGVRVQMQPAVAGAVESAG